MTLLPLFRNTLAGLRMLVVLTVLTGLLYPLAVLGVAQGVLPWQSGGSLITADGARTTTTSDAAGSELIGQEFAGAEWFHTRPSAAGDGWDTLGSSGSNLGPESPDLVAAIRERRAAVAAEEQVPVADVPADAVTTSASGLDPHISLAYAELQASRVADQRGLPLEEVRGLIAADSEGRTFGILGAERVNVVLLNLALADAAD